MTKIRKQKKSKSFRYGVNRRRLNKKLRKRPSINCHPVKNAWEFKKTIRQNMCQMGLVYNVNKVIQLPSYKPKFLVTSSEENKEIKDKSYVAMEIEKETKAPRERNFRLPKTQVRWLICLMDAYQEDYKAMARDVKLNPFQETWKQIRAKIKRFKGIPEQYNEYLESKRDKTEKSP